MHLFLVAMGIFCMRICDVSIGIVRVIYTIHGRRLLSACLDVLESGIWIVAISRLFAYVKEPASMVTIDPTNHAAGGYLPMAFTPLAMRK